MDQSKKKDDDVTHLIENITVEELASEQLVEDVEVSAEDPSKTKDDERVGDASSQTEPAKIILAAHSQGTPDAPDLTPEVQAAQASVDQAVAAEPGGEAPKTKAGLINAMYTHLQTMTTEDLAQAYSTFTAPAKDDDEKDALPDADSDSKDDDSKEDDDEKKEVVTENEDEKDDESDKSDDSDDEDNKHDEDEKDDVKEETEDDSDSDEDEDEDKDSDEDDEKKDEVKESLNDLMAAEKTLTEDFRSKAAIIFESAVDAKVAAEVLRLEENFRVQLDEEVALATSGLTEKVEKYLNYVAATWLEENKVAIEPGLRTEIAENFIKGLQGLFKESYIEVPEGKEDLVESLNKEVSKLEAQLLKSTEANMKLHENVNALERGRILTEASKNLASTEVVKLNTLVESIDFENAENFTKKVKQIKESFLRKPVIPAQETTVETLTESDESNNSPMMEVYSTAISRLAKQSK